MSSNTVNVQILRSYGSSQPPRLLDGQLAYSFSSNTLFIGDSNDNIIPIAGVTPLSAIQSAYGQANIAFAQANAAFNQANSGSSSAAAYNTANAAFAQANLAFAQANAGGQSATTNAAFNVANLAYAEANAAFAAANAAGSSNNVTAAFNTANSAALFANGAFTVANSASSNTISLQGIETAQNSNIASAFTTANVGNTFVNTGGTVSGNVTVSKNLTVSGNLYVLGNLTAINTTQEETNAPLIFLANNNTSSDTVDIGFVGNYNATGNAFTGLFRNPTLKEFIFFQNYASPIGSNNLINISDPSFAYANVYANVFKGNVISHGVDLFTYTNASYAQGNLIYAYANSAYAFANAINVYAYASYSAQNITASFANSAFVTGNSAFITGNSAFIQANAAFNEANSGALFANGAFTAANTAASNTVSLQGIEVAQNTNIASSFAQANLAYAQANAAFAQANIAYTGDTAAFSQANAAFAQANAAFNQANSGSSSANAYNTANAAFNQANASYTTANSAYSQANVAFTQANSAFNEANSGALFANGAFVTANSAALFANGAFVEANSAAIFANGAFTEANNAALFANGAFAEANSAAIFANGAFANANASYNAQNITAGFANSAYAYANTVGTNQVQAFNTANAAYANSNTFIAFITGVELSQNTNIASAYAEANSAAIFANGAFVVANAAVMRAGDTMTGNLVIAGANLIVGTALSAFANGNVTISQVNGQITLKGNTYAGHLLPAANADGTGTGYDLGSATNRWRKIYVTGTTIDIGGALIQAQGNAISLTSGTGATFSVSGTGSSSVGSFASISANAGIDSTNSNSGTIIVTGGIGISNNAFIGGNTTVSYQLTANQLTFGLDGTNQFTAAAPYAYSNASFLTANSAYAAQNITASFANSAYSFANSVYSNYAYPAFIDAQSAQVFANGAFVAANASYNAQNTTASFANSAYTLANSINTYAYSAYAYANTVGTNQAQAFNTANAAYAQANLVYNYANSAYGFSNTVNIFAQAAFTATNSKFSSSGGTISGNVTIGGNLSVNGNISYVGNVINQTISGNTGEFFGYSGNGFSALYAGVPTGFTIEPQTVVQSTGNYNGYVQVNLQNINNGANASGDFVVTADNGTANDTYIDMGINSSTYSQAGYGLTGPNDAYLYAYGNTTTGGGNLVISTYTNKDIIFSTNGGDTPDEVMRITHANTVVIKSSVASVNTVSGSLQVQGGVGVTGNVYAGSIVAPTVYIGGFEQGAYANAIYASQNITASFANSAYTEANLAFAQANAAFAQANSGSSSSAAFNQANLAYNQANAAYATANTVNLASIATNTYVGDGSTTTFGPLSIAPQSIAYTTINYNGITLLRSAYSLTSNGNGTYITFSGAPASTANIEVTVTGLSTATAISTLGANIANLAYAQANAAFAQANLAFNGDTAAFAQANLAYNQANAAFNAANSSSSPAYAFSQANAAFSQANVAFNFANTVNVYAYAAYASENITASFANSAYNKANNALPNTGGTLTGSLEVTGTTSNIVVSQSTTSTDVTNTFAHLYTLGLFSGNTDQSIQVGAQNFANTANASTDLALYNNIGTDTNNYIDLGITSKAYNTTLNGFTAAQPGDGYLYSNGVNLLLGTYTPGTNMKVFVGGYTSANVSTTFNAPNTASSSNTTGTITVAGGVGVTGNVYANAVFTNAVIANTFTATGLMTVQQSMENITNTGNPGTSVTYDFNNGPTYYNSGMSSNWTANFINVPTIQNKSTLLTLIIAQGSSAYIPSTIQVDGTTYSPKWLNATSYTGNANQWDFVTFAIVNIGGTITVLGSYATYN